VSAPVERCTVERRCSSTGMACGVDDRACTSEATSRGLQVICEDQGKQTFVWCPPDTARSDSNVVWLLLAFAVLLAVAGSTFFLVVLRKKT